MLGLVSLTAPLEEIISKLRQVDVLMGRLTLITVISFMKAQLNSSLQHFIQHLHVGRPSHITRDKPARFSEGIGFEAHTNILFMIR